MENLFLQRAMEGTEDLYPSLQTLSGFASKHGAPEEIDQLTHNLPAVDALFHSPGIMESAKAFFHSRKEQRIDLMHSVNSRARHSFYQREITPRLCYLWATTICMIDCLACIALGTCTTLLALYKNDRHYNQLSKRYFCQLAMNFSILTSTAFGLISPKLANAMLMHTYNLDLTLAIGSNSSQLKINIMRALIRCTQRVADPNSPEFTHMTDFYSRFMGNTDFMQREVFRLVIWRFFTLVQESPNNSDNTLLDRFQTLEQILESIPLITSTNGVDQLNEGIRASQELVEMQAQARAATLQAEAVGDVEVYLVPLINQLTKEGEVWHDEEVNDFLTHEAGGQALCVATLFFLLTGERGPPIFMQSCLSPERLATLKTEFQALNEVEKADLDTNRRLMLDRILPVSHREKLPEASTTTDPKVQALLHQINQISGEITTNNRAQLTATLQQLYLRLTAR